MITKRIQFKYKPLRLYKTMAIGGTVPDSQSYDPRTAEYLPDYTLSYLSLKPSVSIVDPDNILPAGDVSDKLVSIRWYAIEDGTRSLIQDSNTDYAITRTGVGAGELVVKRNFTPGSAVTFEFNASYQDTRTGEVYEIVMTHSVQCVTVASNPELSLNFVDHQIWNPVRDQDTVKITASLKIGDTEVPAANRVFVWQKFEPYDDPDNATWRDIDTVNEIMDYDVEVADNMLTVHRDLMGHGLRLRCWVKYDAYGAPAAKTYNYGVPQKVFTIDRQIPGYEPQMELVDKPAAGMSSIHAMCRVQDAGADITDKIKSIMSAEWSTAANNGGDLTYAKVAEGYDVILPTDKITQAYGGMIGLDLIDKGVFSALTDADGKVLTDANGNVLVSKVNIKKS